MNKAFRKNRQNSLSTGEVSQYLKYAIGEITLVVLGILIALYINDVNSKRIEENMAIAVYENIRSQVVADMMAINGSYNHNKVLYDKYMYAAKLIEQNDREKMDTLGKIAFELTRYSDFDKSSTIYQNLLNSGESRLLRNRGILEQVQKLEEAYIKVNRIEKIHFEIVKMIGPNIYKYLNLYSESIRDPEKLFGIDLQNYFMSGIYISRDKEYAYTQAIQNIELLIALIDEELDM